MKRFELFLNGKVYLVEVTRLSRDNALVNVNGTPYEVGINDLTKAGLPKMPETVRVEPQVAPVAAPSPQPHAAQQQAAVQTVGGITTISAPIPGLIIEVKVNVGDKVKPGDVLLVLETMKMENNVTSPRAGTIKEIKVSKNATVNEGAPLIVIGD